MIGTAQLPWSNLDATNAEQAAIRVSLFSGSKRKQPSYCESVPKRLRETGDRVGGRGQELQKLVCTRESGLAHLPRIRLSVRPV
jgi:hypothetical protein